MQTSKILLYILVMAGVTYLIRMLPLALFKQKIKSKFVQSFLYYVPYAVLGAMTFPEILSSTACFCSALVGLIVAVILAYREKGLLTVALSACLGVFFTEQVMRFFNLL
ncbi:MAG: AzlD domain-containing protein [Oscillospiraceae bacterium]